MTVAAAWETISLGRLAKMGSDDGMERFSLQGGGNCNRNSHT